MSGAPPQACSPSVQTLDLEGTLAFADGLFGFVPFVLNMPERLFSSLHLMSEGESWSRGTGNASGLRILLSPGGRERLAGSDHDRGWVLERWIRLRRELGDFSKRHYVHLSRSVAFQKGSEDLSREGRGLGGPCVRPGVHRCICPPPYIQSSQSLYHPRVLWQQ